MEIKTYQLEIKKSIKFNNCEINAFGIGIYNNPDPEKELEEIEKKKVKVIEEERIRRFILELNIKEPKGNKTLATIMMNPSNTYPKRGKESRIDRTVQNIIKIAYVCGYNKIYVYNIFSLINSKSSFQYEKDKFNTDGIIKFLNKNNYDTLIAWGENKEKYTQDILELLNKRNLFVWDLTDKLKPRHPSPINPINRNKFNEFLQQQHPKLIPIKFDENGNIKVIK